MPSRFRLLRKYHYILYPNINLVRYRVHRHHAPIGSNRMSDVELVVVVLLHESGKRKRGHYRIMKLIRNVYRILPHPVVGVPKPHVADGNGKNPPVHPGIRVEPKDGLHHHCIPHINHSRPLIYSPRFLERNWCTDKVRRVMVRRRIGTQTPLRINRLP